jgi:hypothetical protein
MADDARAAPTSRRRWLGCGAAGLALLACALPWHRAQGHKAHFAIAPDFRPSVLPDTNVCTALDHWSVLLIAVVALALQLLLAARWPRQRVLLAVGALVTGLVATGVVPVTAISGHGLFHRIQAMAGQILYLAAALLLIVASLAQLVFRQAPPPVADPPPG